MKKKEENGEFYEGYGCFYLLKRINVAIVKERQSAR